MDLVTVTCNRDKLQMLLQSESIAKFVDPCNHWVIINEPNANIDEWQSLLSPYYTKHRLFLFSIDQIIDSRKFKESKGGWNSQQLYKFSIFKYIRNDYLILDSKNFFVKPTNTDEWQPIIGNGMLTNFTGDNSWKHTIEVYADYLNCPLTFEHLSILTPFTFRKDVLETLGNFDKFLDWFATQPALESEFLIYSMLVQQMNIFPKHNPNPKFHMLTKTYGFKIDELCKFFFEKEHVKVAGIHRVFLYELKESEKIGFNKWLTSLGLTTNLFG